MAEDEPTPGRGEDDESLGLDEAIEASDLETGGDDAPTDDAIDGSAPTGPGRDRGAAAGRIREDGGVDAGATQEYVLEGLIGGDPPEVGISAYRRQFGRLRGYFRSRPERYASVQRTLNQARIGSSYDEFLSRGVLVAALAALFGALGGAAITFVFAGSGVFETLRSPVGIGGPVAAVVGDNRVLVAGTAITIVGAIGVGLPTWVAYRAYPKTVVITRRQKLNVTLPHAIVYMYALSYGGMELPTVFRRLSNAGETYGEITTVADSIVRDMDVFGNDLVTAMENARNITPSDSVERFLDDLLSVLDSGGEVTPFLEDAAKRYLEEAIEEQDDFLETLSILSEVFIVGFVATPLFLVVILVVISLTGGQTLTQLSILVYAVMPFGMAIYIVLIDTLSEPFVQRGTVADPDVSNEWEEDATPAEDDERYRAYRGARRRDRVVSWLRNPFGPIQEEPLYVLALSVPAAIAAAALTVALGFATPTLDGFVSRSVANATWLIVVPLLVATVPLAYYHERQRRRNAVLATRLPAALNILSSANKMGIQLAEGLGLVARATTGTIATELRQVRNDLLWNGSTSRALLSFGARLQVPQLARTTRLLADGLESTGDLSRVLSVAAEDARARYKLERARTREMTSYIAIVVIGYLVYLLVVVLLDANYLTPIAETAEQQAAAGADDGPLLFANIPVDTYRALFFHSAIIQGFGSGLLAGKLSDNTILSGLKYAIGLVSLATVVFLVL
jgi:flagellar protein FlaJ